MSLHFEALFIRALMPLSGIYSSENIAPVRIHRKLFVL